MKPNISKAKAVQVSDFILEEAVCFIPPRLSQLRIISSLVACLKLPEPSLALEAILEREKMGNTVMDMQIAIPHARLKGLTKIRVAIGVCQEPSETSIRIYVLFLSPREDTKTHLLFLAAVSSLFQTEDLVNALLQMKGPHEVVRKIREIEKGI